MRAICPYCNQAIELIDDAPSDPYFAVHLPETADLPDDAVLPPLEELCEGTCMSIGFAFEMLNEQAVVS